MCGIAGIVGKRAWEYRHACQAMMDAMQHRGPDGSGVYVSPCGGAVLGHTRLAIIDRTDRSMQPMQIAVGQGVLVYNGECYNFRELREVLTREGYNFCSDGDTEVVGAAIFRWGAMAFERINGMLACAYWDTARCELMLARDRFGQKPVYYWQGDGIFVFASEVRALLASGLVPRELDWGGLLGYVELGAVQCPRTILQGVRELTRGAFMLVRGGVPGPEQTYWKPFNSHARTDPGGIRECFDRTVQRHLVSDVPIGVLLSGGVDSSAICLTASQLQRDPVMALNVSFPEWPQYSEKEIAQRVSSLADAKYLEVAVTEHELNSIVNDYFPAVDQPSHDGMNMFIVTRVAAQAGLRVVLSGLGGDELFGGYPVFRDFRILKAVRRLAGGLGPHAARLLELGGGYHRLWGKLSDLLASPVDDFAVYMVRRKIFTKGMIRRLMPFAFQEERLLRFWDPDTEGPLSALLERLKEPDRISALESAIYMGNLMLRDGDAMGMANSVEVRMPFLDAEFASYVQALGPEARVPRTVPKWMFVEAMGARLPSWVWDKPKAPFMLPFQEWMKRELGDMVRDRLRVLARRIPFFDTNALDQLCADFESNPEGIGWARPWTLAVLGDYAERQRLSL